MYFFLFFANIKVGFCGYLGYTNFFREDWLQAILSWQSKSGLGCFIKNVNSPVGIVTHDIPIKKLEDCNKNGEIQDPESKDKCLPHFTAVGLIALSAHWDYLLDLNSNLQDEWYSDFVYIANYFRIKYFHRRIIYL